MCKKDTNSRVVISLVSIIFISQLFIIIRLIQISEYVSIITEDFHSKIGNMTSSMREDFVYQASVLSKEIKFYQESMDNRLDLFQKEVDRMNLQLNLIVNKINNTENNFQYFNVNNQNNPSYSLNYSELVPP